MYMPKNPFAPYPYPYALSDTGERARVWGSAPADTDIRPCKTADTAPADTMSKKRERKKLLIFFEKMYSNG